jgi:hypothetical protein
MGRGIEAHGSLIRERLQSQSLQQMTSSSDWKEKKKGKNSLDGLYGSVKDMGTDGIVDGKAQMLGMDRMKNG